MKDKVTGKIIIDYRIKNAAVTSYTLPFALNPEHTYQWKIKVQKPSGLYSRWVPINHKLITGIPSPVYPSGMTDGLTPTLQWTGAEYAENYHVLIQDVDTLEVIVNKIIGNELKYTIDKLLKADHRYRWKVRVQEPDGEYSEWSYFEFTDVNPLSSITNTVTLSWKVPGNRVDGSLLQPGDISQYIIEYQKGKEPIKKIYINDAVLTELRLNNLSDGHYQFKIRVVDKMGLASDLSEGSSITLPRSSKP